MKNRIQICIYILLALLAACSKDATNSKPSSPAIVEGNFFITKPANIDGFGASTKPLAGTPFVFPDGVLLAGNISTSLNGADVFPYYEAPTDGTLPFFFTLQNNNSSSVSVIFPGGLVIPCTDTLLQGAVLIQPDTFVIPAKNSLYVKLFAFCLNDKRTFSYTQAYEAPLISSNSNLDPLIRLLAKKQTIMDDPGELVQKAVWDIADSGRMTTTDIANMGSFQ